MQIRMIMVMVLLFSYGHGNKPTHRGSAGRQQRAVWFRASADKKKKKCFLFSSIYKKIPLENQQFQLLL